MTRELSVDGMSCGGCEQNVIDALEGVPGVESAVADHEAGTASVEGEVDVEDLVAAVDEAGYSASA